MSAKAIHELPFSLEQGEFVGSPFDTMYVVERSIYRSRPDAAKQVYSVHHHETAEHVALKMHDPSLAAEFETELETAEKLSGEPGFVPYRGYGEHKTKSGLYIPWLAFDYEEKGSLEAEINSTGLPDAERVEELMAAFHGVAVALDAIHAEGEVFRDVKPANMLRGEGDELLVCDYGSVIQRGRYPQFEGTIGFIAPEAMQGMVIPANDVFGIGVTMYRALTHRFPFSSSSDQAYIDSIMRGDRPVFPDKHNPAVKQELSQLVMNCIKLGYEQRTEADVLPQIIEASI